MNFDLLIFFQTFAALTGLIMTASEYIANITKANGTWAIVQTWIIGFALAFLGMWMQIGIFTTTTVIVTILTAAFANLAASGLFSIPLAQTFLEFIKARFVQPVIKKKK